MNSVKQFFQRKEIQHGAIIFCLALLVRIAGIFIYGVEVYADAVEYDTIAHNLVKGNGYSLSVSPPFESTTQREPVYPLFLALIYFIFGHSHLIAVLWQCVLGGLSCVLIYKIALVLYENHRLALLAGIVNSIYLPIAIFSLRLYSESTAIFLTGLIAYLALLILKKEKTGALFLGLGVAIGLLILNKLAFQFFPLLLLGVIIFLSKDKKAWGKAVLCLILIIGFLSPWMFFNKKVHGNYSLGNTVRKGANFYIRVFNDGIKGPFKMRTAFYNELVELEKGDIDVDQINADYIEKALTIIKSHPFRYIAGVFIEIKDLWRFGIRAEEMESSENTKVVGLKAKIFIAVKYFFLIINFSILFMGIFGFILKRNKETTILMTIILYSTLIYSLVSCALPRHNVQVLQFMIIFSIYFISRLRERF